MTEPTDAELDMLIDDVAGLDSSNEAFRKFARAVLAKFGTPPAVAGKPVAWLSTDSIGERYLCFTKPNDSDPARPLVFGDTTPQPTQAQAGAVPLTVDEVEQLIAQWSYELHGDRARYLVRMTEQHHGIKGGQHGAE